MKPTNILTFHVTLCMDDQHESATKTATELEQYLDADPGHSVILHGCDGMAFQPAIFIMRGLTIHMFYWGRIPMEHPNAIVQVDGGAAKAMQDATGRYCL